MKPKPMDANEKVKFCLADSYGNLKIRFSENKNVSYDSIRSFLQT